MTNEMNEQKRYTAQEMREMANREKFKCSFVTRTLNGGIILDCTSDVRAMLIQAAEIREKDALMRNLNALEKAVERVCSRDEVNEIVAIKKEIQNEGK